MGIVELLSENLGLQEEQVKGGAGLLLRLAKQKLRNDDFSKVAHYFPNIEEMIEAAPKIGEITRCFAGLGSAIGGEASGPANLASLASGFSKLGFDTRMTAEFVSQILKNLRSRGGERIKILLEDALS
jgi:hypothetical protein